VDPHNANSLQEAVQDVLGGNGGHVIIDLEDCTYIDSAGLATLFALTSRARQMGGRVAAVRPPAQFFHLFQLVRLTDERGFEVYADLEGARTSLAGA
jgi:anti-anti-sigma factor